MKFGLTQNIQWPESADQKAEYDRAINEARLVEELGFYQATFTEHHFSRHSIVSSSLTVLAHLAALTTTLRLGTSVITLPFHNPVRLAEEAAIVDLLSNGRLELGVGRGFIWAEYNGLDIPLEESTARYQEALDVILKAWTAPGRFSHDGAFFKFNDISVEPKPLQKPHPPISFAVTSPESATRAGRMGFRVQLPRGLTMEQTAERVELYKAALAERGAPFHPTDVSAARFLHLSTSKEKAWEEMSPYYRWFQKTIGGLRKPSTEARAAPANPFADDLPRSDESILFCTPDECARHIEELEKIGVGVVNLSPNLAALPIESAIDTLRTFEREVMPQFAEKALV